MPTLEQVLKDAQSLPPDEQRLLSELLEAPRSLEEIAAEQGVKPPSGRKKKALMILSRRFAGGAVKTRKEKLKRKRRTKAEILAEKAKTE